MSAFYRTLRRPAQIVSGAYGLTALFFLSVSGDFADYRLLAVYDKIMIYLLTPLTLLLFCRVETVMRPTLTIRLGSRRRALAVCLALQGACAAFCSLLWLAMTDLCAFLRYQTPLFCPGDAGSQVILRYILLWLLLAEISLLIGKLLPRQTAALSCAAGYLLFAAELLSLSTLLPPHIGLLFSWFYRKAGGAVLCFWCAVLAAVLVCICDREDID
ncbi:MAG: hypothetical protein NC432_00365 [Roseburia sp.]|nr:hypothetical protein [Roseburia sp.]MCM1098360.1 hypothetical protein [Ruminococcus flavefaciens]